MSRARAGIALAAALALTPSCGTRARQPSQGAASSRPAGASIPSGDSAEPPAPRDDGRLPSTVSPLRYTLSLGIDPAKSRFSGTSKILVSVPAQTTYVVLHARGMNVASATARTDKGTTTATTKVRLARGRVVPDELVLTFAAPLEAGTAEIEIAYDAPFATDLTGLYRVEEGGLSYAFTQFQVADARRAFPCFDEPGYKTPFDVKITTPVALRALSNAPESWRDQTADGQMVHQFATSRPMPTYLVAFAVGDFDVVEWQKEPFPLRAVTTKGRANLAGIGLEAAAALAARLADYFAFPYPYEKLDLVAVPDFAAGAMENAGLITFRDTYFLLDPRRATVSTRRTQAQVIAHELAHQWLGDLVTMQWWDDLWLNEGFATWAEAKIVDEWKPSFGATFEQIAGMQSVMDTDALASARAVREPVRSTSEAEEAFDAITYDKGAAVLRMLEGWLGPDVFRRGVQRYVHEHAWKNARAADLFAALEFVSVQRVGPLANSFLDQPGVPEVLVNWTCPNGVGKLELSQSEWRPLGSGAERAHEPWTLPVCVATDTQKTKNCFTVARDPIARDLGGGCPSWVYPNTEGGGYYRFVVDAARLVALARGARALSPLDRLGVLSNAWAEVRQGAVGPSALFEVLPAFDPDNNRHVVEEIGSVLQGMGQALVEDDAREAFQRWVVARLGARKAALGWEDGPRRGGDNGQADEDRTLERRSVLWTMGEIAGDEATLTEAQVYAEKWLRDPTSVPPDTAAIAVPLASRRAGPARLFQLQSAAVAAKNPEDRALAIRSMGMFDDPTALRSALDRILSTSTSDTNTNANFELRLSELKYLFGAASGHRAARPVLYAWEKENWAKLRAHLPGSFGQDLLIQVVGAICNRATLDDARAFFVPATQGMEGIKRELDEAFESANLCIALREHAAAEVTRALKRK